jgi:hypothetical protein
MFKLVSRSLAVLLSAAVIGVAWMILESQSNEISPKNPPSTLAQEDNIIYLRQGKPGPIPPKPKPWFTRPGSNVKYCGIADFSNGAAYVTCADMKRIKRQEAKYISSGQ